MKSNYLKDIFALLILDNDKGRYKVYLVNRSKSVTYSRVSSTTGAFEGDLDGLVETGTAEKVYGALRPQSSILLEAGEQNWLDMTAWYHLDIYSGTEKVGKVWFDFRYPYHYDAQKEEIPYLGKTGLKIELGKVR